jgi:hypothetical protein
MAIGLCDVTLQTWKNIEVRITKIEPISRAEWGWRGVWDDFRNWVIRAA